MGEFDVTQRTSDGMFNATELMKQWNAANGSKKEIKHFLEENKNTQEFINALISEESLNGRNSAYLKTRGVRGGTWMHPYLFVDFAMWVSVEFKSKVIKYVVDGLILSRQEAGDFYNEMCGQILDSYVSVNGCKPNPTIYQREALMIKEAVTDKKDRNEMTESELSAITALQKVNTILIKRGVGIDSRKKSILLFAESLKQ